MQEVNESNFEKEVLNSNKPVVVDNFADWCGPCKAISPILEELSKELKNIKFVKLDVDGNQELASEYGVMSIPTLIIFKNGKPIGSIIGAMSKTQLKAKIEELI